METREYLHGPLEAVGRRVRRVVFGRERERALAAELASFGAAVALLTDTGAGDADGVDVIDLPQVATARGAGPADPARCSCSSSTRPRLRGLTIGELRRQQHDTKVA